ncbi:MAG TPA: HPr(Ser) kinase/phosphatase [bacterium]|nr:HPr(Ser) kinase/phosphatase [bacterium]HPN35774.1 HPr(Ser) kinase/phosphatase [bacterium]
MEIQSPVASITVEKLFEDNSEEASLQIINSKNGFNREIRERELNRPGLALSGFVELFTYWRIQIMGNTEVGYLNTLFEAERLQTIQRVLGFDLPCIIFTNSNKPPGEMIEIANRNDIPLLSTPLSTTALTHHLSEYLNAIFAPQLILHGSLVDVHGVGMLITGESAIGKSEMALDLIERGHQLVADDVVTITRAGRNRLEGAPSDLLMHHMEIRGLGIIDVRRMFGIRAIRGKKQIQIILHLERFNAIREYERTGMDEGWRDLLGVRIPMVVLPILPGKNLTVIAEGVALNHKLKQLGENAAKDFDDWLISRMKKDPPTRDDT